MLKNCIAAERRINVKKIVSHALAVTMLMCLVASSGGSACAADVRILDREDLMNILLGCAILGTGGGGSLDEGIEGHPTA